MATYAVGDLQGCYSSFQQLLERIDFDEQRDQLWLVGDLINRGSGSLQTLRWIYKHKSAVITVLGNHDLHTLAVAEGFMPPHKNDTLQALLEAPDRDELLQWLRRQPLIYGRSGYVMVHAGLLPQWTAAQALQLGAEVEAILQSDDYRSFLAAMYGNQPDRWDDSLQGMDRLRLITNAMTRLRVCTADGTMNFKFKGVPADMPEGCYAWFDVPGRQSVDTPIIFGHWSALGLLRRDNLHGLDTGCLWGQQLTALRLEDQVLFQVDCDPTDGPKRLF